MPLSRSACRRSTGSTGETPAAPGDSMSGRPWMIWLIQRIANRSIFRSIKKRPSSKNVSKCAFHSPHAAVLMRAASSAHTASSSLPCAISSPETPGCSEETYGFCSGLQINSYPFTAVPASPRAPASLAAASARPSEAKPGPLSRNPSNVLLSCSLLSRTRRLRASKSLRTVASFGISLQARTNSHSASFNSPSSKRAFALR
mmetsp:Transcript_37427/g.65845  ORF Transcript_37427/g.65845 Transcript_37427/m.65845 type:complete len:202 (-) Transcript_37427:405-1010(-)